MNNNENDNNSNNTKILYIIKTLSDRVDYITSDNYSNITLFLAGNSKEIEMASASNKKLNDCFLSFVHKYNSYVDSRDTSSESQPIKKLSLKEIETLDFLFNEEQDYIIQVMGNIKKLISSSNLNTSIDNKLKYNNECFELLFNLFEVD
jgi:hypothetical protein